MIVGSQSANIDKARWFNYEQLELEGLEKDDEVVQSLNKLISNLTKIIVSKTKSIKRLKKINGDRKELIRDTGLLKHGNMNSNSSNKSTVSRRGARFTYYVDIVENNLNDSLPKLGYFVKKLTKKAIKSDLKQDLNAIIKCTESLHRERINEDIQEAINNEE